MPQGLLPPLKFHWRSDRAVLESGCGEVETVVSRFVCFGGVVVGAPTAFDGETNACDTPTATRSRRATVLFIIFLCVEQCSGRLASDKIVPHPTSLARTAFHSASTLHLPDSTAPTDRHNDVAHGSHYVSSTFMKFKARHVLEKESCLESGIWG